MPLRSWLMRSKIETVISVGHLIISEYNKVPWEKESAVKHCHIYNKGGKPSTAIWLIELPHWGECEEMYFLFSPLRTITDLHYLCFVS